MKFFLIICASLVCIASAEARPYQEIINDLRSEVKKGDAKAVTLQKKIDDLDTWAKDRWEREQKALAENAKLKAVVKKALASGFGLAVLIGIIGIVISSRMKKKEDIEDEQVVALPVTPKPKRAPAKSKRPSPRKVAK